MAPDQGRGGSVQVVTENGTTETRKVNPKLMGASRQRLALHKGVSFRYRKDPITGQRQRASLALGAVFPKRLWVGKNG